MPCSNPIQRSRTGRASCETAARPDRHHRGTGGGRRASHERYGHHVSSHTPAAWSAIPRTPHSIHPPGLWRDMMNRWLTGEE